MPDNPGMTFAPLGDSAVVVTVGTELDEPALARVQALVAALADEPVEGILDIVPAYATVTVFYNVSAMAASGLPPHERVCRLITERAEKPGRRWSGLLRLGKSAAPNSPAASVVEIPVCYGNAFGPDLVDVAHHCRLAPEEIVAKHTAAEYRVHAVGFAPGFGYLGGLPRELHTPRRATPRLEVPAGSVGIGWQQTGVYPLASPGGWQIIGRTPLAMFRPDRESPALLSVGDTVKFRAITAEELASWT